MSDYMNFLLGGTICLAYAHGHRNNQTKTKSFYKFGPVYMYRVIKMSCSNKITSDFTCKTKRNRLDLPKYAGVKAALLSVEKIPEAIKHK